MSHSVLPCSKAIVHVWWCIAHNHKFPNLIIGPPNRTYNDKQNQAMREIYRKKVWGNQIDIFEIDGIENTQELKCIDQLTTK